DSTPGCHQVSTGPGDDAKLDLHATRPDVDSDRRAGEGGAPARTAARDPEHLGDFEPRLAGHGDEDAAPHPEPDRACRGTTGRRRVDHDGVELGLGLEDGVARRWSLELGAHVAPPGSAATGSGSATSGGAAGADSAGAACARDASSRSASAISCGTRVRAVSAPT